MVSRTGVALIVSVRIFLGCAPNETLHGFDEPRVRQIAAEISEERLTADVASLYERHLTDTRLDCGMACDASPLAHELSHDATRVWLTQRLVALGYQVTEQVNPTEEVAFVNLLAELPGTRNRDQVIVLGAHYDAYFGGADDNSTGVAAVVELARILRNYRFESTVRFAFFDLEELACRGSSLYVNTLRADERPLVLILDSLGHRKSTPKSQAVYWGIPWPSIGDFLLVQSNEIAAAQASDVELINDKLKSTRLYSIIAPADGSFVMTEGLLNGDHIPFWLAGVPALNLGDTASNRDDRIHDASDVPVAIDGQFLSDNVRLIAAIVAYFSGQVP